MRKFNITVNGKSYEVEVEEIGGVVSSSPITYTAPAAPKPAAPAPKVETPAQKEVAAAPAAAKPAAAPAPKPAAAPAAGGEEISCPMPGTILAVNVKPGDTVKNGDVLFVLEAMKMENEIMAPRDAKVAAVNVTKGASVNTGDVLAILE